MRTIAMAILVMVFASLAGCGPQTPAEKKIEQGDGPNVEVGVPKPKECSDYANGQEVLADELGGKLTKADEKSLDPNNDGKLCNEPGTEWKDTRTKVEGLPPFEVPFVSDGDIPGLKSGEITVDISEVNKPDKHLLEAISWETVEQVGVGTETGYRAAVFTYRDAETYKELDAFGVYVSDREAAELVNEYVREQEGWKIDFYDADKVPAGGGVETITFY